MAVILKQIDEIYEVDTEREAEEWREPGRDLSS